MRPAAPSFRHTAEYFCGPAKLFLTFAESSMHRALDGLLSQYDAPWPRPTMEISVVIQSGLPSSEISKPAGNYLRSYRLQVDRRGQHLISLSNVGVWMDFDEPDRQAQILVPDHPDMETVIEEVEQQLVLLLARAWANAGWTPLHAGSLIPPDDSRCLFICAPSGVGKTTLITAMLCRGWRTLGDDKILLRKENGAIHGRALSRRVHLHPSLTNWFPKIGDLEQWPLYSRWTAKRMVQIEAIWPGQLVESAVPAALVQLERAVGNQKFEATALDATGALHTLLRQIVIPAAAADAQPLISCAAQLTGQLRAIALAVGNNIFDEDSNVEQLEEILRKLLP